MTKVVGKRVAGESPGWTLYIVAVVLVVLSVRSFVAGDAPWGGVYAFGAVVVALVGRTLRGEIKRTSEILSACPVCGAQRQRSFTARGSERDLSTSCGACIAYVRVNLDSLEVKEEPEDTIGGFYFVGRAQYESIVPRGGDRFQFKMPTMCAVCGAADAPQTRTLDPMAKGDAGVLGAVASEAANLAVGAQANRSYESNTLSSDAELDLLLYKVEMRVCADHIAERGVQYGDGNLSFGSYRHYKAFCALNHIAPEKQPSEDNGPPEARVVAS